MDINTQTNMDIVSEFDEYDWNRFMEVNKEDFKYILNKENGLIIWLYSELDLEMYNRYKEAIK